MIVVIYFAGVSLHIVDWGGGRFKSGPFLYRKNNRGMKESNVSSSC